MRILSVSVTAAGRHLAARLPYEHIHGNLVETVERRWSDVDGFVLLVATGAAVRIIGPLLGEKRTDPAVVCVDDAAHFAVSLLGGHARGANALAVEVAGLLGATPVITTATDSLGIPALDMLPGYTATGDIATVMTALLDGRPVSVETPTNWPIPDSLAAAATHAAAAAIAGMRSSEPAAYRVIITDENLRLRPLPASVEGGHVLLHPPSLVAGIGTATNAPVQEAAALLAKVLSDTNLAPDSVAEIATVDRRRHEPAILALGLPIRTFTPEQLAVVPVPHPSDVVRAAIGTPSVAEAAALLAAGPDAALVATKRTGPNTTVAIARRGRPRGSLAVVGLGPGDLSHRSPAATRAIRNAQVVIGYSGYVEQCADLLTPNQRVLHSPLGAEMQRAQTALELAAAGEQVAMVCSGDAGIYAMASPVLELAGNSEFAGVDVTVVPGITAALAASAALGAPLGHDHVLISLSDLLTPWSAIEARIEAAARADLVAVFYNPRSQRRNWQLERAREILFDHRPFDTPVGVVTDAARPHETVLLTTLGDLDPETVGMTTTVIVGATTTVVRNGRMVTPRGYNQ
jgi:cobalt-precorrin 5A hydrolase/precorrin-3B C17-methyltransferase